MSVERKGEELGGLPMLPVHSHVSRLLQIEV